MHGKIISPECKSRPSCEASSGMLRCFWKFSSSRLRLLLKSIELGRHADRPSGFPSFLNSSPPGLSRWSTVLPLASGSFVRLKKRRTIELASILGISFCEDEPWSLLLWEEASEAFLPKSTLKSIAFLGLENEFFSSTNGGWFQSAWVTARPSNRILKLWMERELSRCSFSTINKKTIKPLCPSFICVHAEMLINYKGVQPSKKCHLQNYSSYRPFFKFICEKFGLDWSEARWWALKEQVMTLITRKPF